MAARPLRDFLVYLSNDPAEYARFFTSVAVAVEMMEKACLTPEQQAALLSHDRARVEKAWDEERKAADAPDDAGPPGFMMHAPPGVSG
jgi:hypothetical protein